MLKENQNPNAHCNNEALIKKKTPTNIKRQSFGYLQPTTSSINRRRLLKESKIQSPAIIANNQLSYNDNDNNENSSNTPRDNKLFTPLLDINNIVNNNEINSNSSSKYSIQFTETKKTISPVDYSTDVLRELMTPYSENNNDDNHITVVTKYNAITCSLLDDDTASPTLVKQQNKKHHLMSLEKKCFFACLIAILLALLSAYYVNYHKQQIQSIGSLKIKLNYSGSIADTLENENDDMDLYPYDSIETAIEIPLDEVDIAEDSDIEIAEDSNIEIAEDSNIETEIAKDSDTEIAEDSNIETEIAEDSDTEIAEDSDIENETALDIEDDEDIETALEIKNAIDILNMTVSCDDNEAEEVQAEDCKTETIYLDQIENKPDPMINTKYYEIAQHLSVMLSIFSLRMSFSFIKFYMSN